MKTVNWAKLSRPQNEDYKNTRENTISGYLNIRLCLAKIKRRKMWKSRGIVMPHFYGNKWKYSLTTKILQVMKVYSHWRPLSHIKAAYSGKILNSSSKWLNLFRTPKLSLSRQQVVNSWNTTNIGLCLWSNWLGRFTSTKVKILLTEATHLS